MFWKKLDEFKYECEELTRTAADSFAAIKILSMFAICEPNKITNA